MIDSNSKFQNIYSKGTALLPLSLTTSKKKTSEVWKRTTRQSKKFSILYIPKYRSNRLLRSIRCHCHRVRM